MKTKKPNLLLIVNDHQAYYGHGMQGGVKPLRPHFDALAASGAHFEQSYSVSPMCGPARRTFLTGLYPHTTGQHHNDTNPPYRDDVYLDNLHHGGYRNFYYGKWHAGPGCAYDHYCKGFTQGGGYGNPYNTPDYERYCEERGLPRATHRIKQHFRHDGHGSYRSFNNMVPDALYQCEEFFSGEHAMGTTITPKDSHEAFFLANMACDQLEKLAKDDSEEPFALRVDFWGPHQPFFPTQEYLDLYDKTQIQPYPSLYDDLEDKPHVLKMESSHPMGNNGEVVYPTPISPEGWQDILHHCYAHGSLVDAAGGRVIEKLKELGLDENTLIMWTTDHGDAIACHGGHFDKDSHLAMEVIKTPMAAAWKGKIEPGTTYDGFVSTCDVPCTLMDAAALSFGNRVDGTSVLKFLSGEAPKRDALLVETHGHGYGTTIVGRAILHDGWKYACFENDKDELYNLESDPYEMKNLAALPEYAQRRTAMREKLKAEQANTLDPVVLTDICAD